MFIGADNGFSPGRHQAICRTKAEILQFEIKFSEMQLCFCNIIERVRVWFIIRFILSCLILPFQISTSVNCAMVVVHTSVLRHTAPIIARVEMASSCVQTNMDVTVSLTIFLTNHILFLRSHQGRSPPSWDECKNWRTKLSSAVKWKYLRKGHSSPIGQQVVHHRKPRTIQKIGFERMNEWCCHGKFPSNSKQNQKILYLSYLH